MAFYMEKWWRCKHPSLRIFQHIYDNQERICHKLISQWNLKDKNLQKQKNQLSMRTVFNSRQFSFSKVYKTITWKAVFVCLLHVWAMIHILLSYTRTAFFKYFEKFNTILGRDIYKIYPLILLSATPNANYYSPWNYL